MRGRNKMVNPTKENQPPIINLGEILQEQVYENNIFEKVVTIDTWKDKIGNIFLRIYHISLGIFRLFGNMFRFIRIGGHNKSQKEYCFTQQYNDSCHLSPLQNLKILKTIKDVGYDLSKVSFHTRREWLGENQDFLQTWHTAIGKLTSEEGKEKYPALYNYMIGSFKDAPVFPHFYDEKGKRPFNGFKGLVEFGELPYFLIDIDDIKKVNFRVGCKNFDFGEMLNEDDLGLKTGFVKDKDEIKLYNKVTKTFDPITNLDWVVINSEEKDLVITIDEEKLPDNARATYALPKAGHKVHMHNIRGLGFKQMGVDHELGGGLKLKNSKGEEHTYIIYQMSLLKMLFLASGVDSDNNVIDENHHLHQVYKEFKEIMSEDPNNLWSEKSLSKEMVLQYQIANIFQKNPELRKKAIATVDALTGNWKNYVKLCNGHFYNEMGQQMKEPGIKDYTLGHDQALAYYIMQNIRLAWYSSVNPSVVIKAVELGLPNFMGQPFHEFIKCKFNEKVSVKLADNKLGRVSFMGVWDELLPLLKKAGGERKDFMSFDDHGWVVSFDENMIRLQSETKSIHDRAFLKRLGFAGIESWLSTDLNLWYTRPRKIEKLSTK